MLDVRMLMELKASAQAQRGRAVWVLNYANAIKWLRRAAIQGNAMAQTTLGVMYENGQGVEVDYAEAFMAQQSC